MNGKANLKIHSNSFRFRVLILPTLAEKGLFLLIEIPLSSKIFVARRSQNGCLQDLPPAEHSLWLTNPCRGAGPLTLNRRGLCTCRRKIPELSPGCCNSLKKNPPMILLCLCLLLMIKYWFIWGSFHYCLLVPTFTMIFHKFCWEYCPARAPNYDEAQSGDFTATAWVISVGTAISLLTKWHLFANLR